MEPRPGDLVRWRVAAALTPLVLVVVVELARHSV